MLRMRPGRFVTTTPAQLHWCVIREQENFVTLECPRDVSKVSWRDRVHACDYWTCRSTHCRRERSGQWGKCRRRRSRTAPKSVVLVGRQRMGTRRQRTASRRQRMGTRRQRTASRRQRMGTRHQCTRRARSSPSPARPSLATPSPPGSKPANPSPKLANSSPANPSRANPSPNRANPSPRLDRSRRQSQSHGGSERPCN